MLATAMSIMAKLRCRENCIMLYTQLDYVVW